MPTKPINNENKRAELFTGPDIHDGPWEELQEKLDERSNYNDKLWLILPTLVFHLRQGELPQELRRIVGDVLIELSADEIISEVSNYLLKCNVSTNDTVLLIGYLNQASWTGIRERIEFVLRERLSENFPFLQDFLPANMPESSEKTGGVGPKTAILGGISGDVEEKNPKPKRKKRRRRPGPAPEKTMIGLGPKNTSTPPEQEDVLQDYEGPWLAPPATKESLQTELLSFLPALCEHLMKGIKIPILLQESILDSATELSNPELAELLLNFRTKASLRV